jgi:arylsulfatase A-like enzyme
MFTDYYAENSCTAGRSTFITGQCAKRTGLSKVGIPGAPCGFTGPGYHHCPGTKTIRLYVRPVW